MHEPLTDMWERIIASRRSVRGFLPTPVPEELMQRIFTTAGKAPSNCNVQPWIVHVVSGEVRQKVIAALSEEADAGRLDPDVPLTNHYVAQYRTRRIGAAMALFEATGVARDDKDARHRSFMRNYRLFDAPHAAFIFMPRYFGHREAVDIGIYVQSLMLTLTAHGLGSCAQGAVSHYGGALKRVLGVSDNLVCLLGLSFGYPDEAHPSTAAITDRASLGETTIFHT